MVKKTNPLLSFIEDRKVLTGLFIISCGLLFVTSNIAFDIPQGFWTNIAHLVDVFTGAYVTGILMLLFVEEIPHEKRR